MVRGHVCHLPFWEDYDISLPSTKHVAIRKNYSTKRYTTNNPYKHKQINQTIERYLFNNIDLLICYDREIWQGNMN
jgi:hypothetical protein